jgi:hypothetical protein
VQLRLPDGATVILGSLQFRNQTHLLFRRAFAVSGNYQLIVAPGSEFQRTFDFTVVPTAASGLNYFTVNVSDRIVAGEPFKFTVTARNANHLSTRITATVGLTLQLANGTTVNLGNVNFQNQTSYTGMAETNVPGVAILTAGTGNRLGTAPVQILPQPVLRARIVLGDWQGATRPLIRVKLYHAGTRKLVRSYAVPIQDDGTISLDVPPGVYDVALKADRWLQQIRARVSFPVAQTLVFSGPAGQGMANGDTNGDNTVDAADVANVQGDQGGAPSGQRGLTDLNGDGTVNQTDLDIVQRNLGQSGDR